MRKIYLQNLLEKKKSVYKWTRTVQTHVFQGSAVFAKAIKYGILIFKVLRIICILWHCVIHETKSILQIVLE